MNKAKSLKENLYLQLFYEFFKLGLFTIGGGMAMLPLIQDMVVNKKRWMSEEEAIDAIAISQGLPGVIAINMATYIGRKQKGFWGSVCATIGVILPSFLIIILVSEALRAMGGNSYLQGALTGIKAAAIGLIGYSAYTIGRKVLKDVFSWIIAVAAFVAIVAFDFSAVVVIVCALLAGLICSKRKEPLEEGGDRT